MSCHLQITYLPMLGSAEDFARGFLPDKKAPEIVWIFFSGDAFGEGVEKKSISDDREFPPFSALMICFSNDEPTISSTGLTASVNWKSPFDA